MRLADGVSNSNASRRPAAERRRGGATMRLADEVREGKYTPKRKKQDLACAEPPPRERRQLSPSKKRLQDKNFFKQANLTRNYLLYKTTKA